MPVFLPYVAIVAVVFTFRVVCEMDATARRSWRGYQGYGAWASSLPGDVPYAPYDQPSRQRPRQPRTRYPD